MEKIIPKGTLIPIGGGEDKEESKEILRRIVSETGKKYPKMCLIMLATDVPEKAVEVYTRAFKELDISTLSTIYYSSRKEADSQENLKKIKRMRSHFIHWRAAIEIKHTFRWYRYFSSH